MPTRRHVLCQGGLLYILQCHCPHRQGSRMRRRDATLEMTFLAVARWHSGRLGSAFDAWSWHGFRTSTCRRDRARSET